MRFRSMTKSALVSILAYSAPVSAFAQGKVAQAPIDDKSDPNVLDRPARLEVAAVPLTEALSRLSKTSGVIIAFSPSVLQHDNRSVTCSCAGVTVDSALQRLLGGTAFEYSEFKGQVIIFREPGARPRLIAPTVRSARYASGGDSRAAPPSRLVGGDSRVGGTGSNGDEGDALERRRVGTIVGTVTEAGTGSPIVNAQIAVDGAGRAFTDGDGRYRIVDVPSGLRSVSVTSIGYRRSSQEVDVGDGATVTLNFALEVSPSTLDELVVTATGEQRRLEVGNAISRIAADPVVASAPVRDLAELIAGRAPGVQVFFANGIIGQAPRFRIRGISSFTVTNDPLVIIDGVRAENSPGTLGDFQSIAGFSPLRTGRLASLNPEEIESIEVVKGPSAATLYGTDAANGVLLITTKRGQSGRPTWTVYSEQGFVKPPTNWYTNYYGWGRNTATGSTQQCLLEAIAAGACVQDSITSFNPLRDAPNSPLGTGYRQSYGAQVSGGTPDMRYFLSGELEDETGYLRLPGVEQEFLRQQRGGASIPKEQIRPNAMQKLSFRGNVATDLGSTADLAISAGLVRNNTRLPRISIFDAAEWGRGTADTLTQWIGGLRPGIALAPVTTDRATLFTGGVTANWRPEPWLTTRAVAGMDFSNSSYSYMIRRGEGWASVADGRRFDQDIAITVYTGDLQAAASFDPWLGIRSRTTVGLQYNRRIAAATGLEAAGLPPGQGNVAGAAVNRGSKLHEESVIAGGYVEEQVAYRERLFLTGALRFDGASSFGNDFQVAVYPKASASWLAFSDPRNWLGTLRLRAAYGASGVQPSPVAALARDTLFQSLVDGATTTGATLLARGNPQLRPERQAEFEAGFDAEMFDQRVNLEVTLYNRQSSDALVDRPIAPSFGLGERATEQINVGEVRNRGIEGLIKARLVEGEVVSWEMELNGNVNQNRLLKLAPDVPQAGSGTIRHVPGHALYGLWDRAILAHDDTNADGIIDPSEVVLGDTAVFLGSTIPSRQLTIGTSLGLLGERIHVSALVDYRGGHARWNNAAANRCVRFIASCREVNDPTVPLDRQAAAAASNHPSGVVWTGYIEDGGFARFRELAIRLSDEILAKPFGAHSATLTLSARNIATWTRYSGVDPESTNSPGSDLFADNGTAPPGRHFIARIMLGY